MFDLIAYGCRFALLLIFMISSYTKIRDFRAFKETIHNIPIVKYYVKTSAVLILLVELSLVFILAVGGIFMAFGFLYSTIVLLVFTIVVIVLIRQNIATSCSCFGSNKSSVTWYTAIRDILITACSLAGLICTMATDQAIDIPLSAYLIVGLMGIVFVVLIVNFEAILESVIMR